MTENSVPAAGVSAGEHPADQTLRAVPAAPPEPAGECRECPSRRGLLRGAAAVGVVGAVGGTLAACSSSGSGGGSSSGSTGGSGSGSGSGSGGSGALGPVSDIPVGGGKVFASAQVVVTQPTAGSYKGFSAICTHAGCTVSDVSNGVITCPCHGSQFRVADGSVAQGPATSPLPPVKINVKNGEISQA